MGDNSKEVEKGPGRGGGGGGTANSGGGEDTLSPVGSDYLYGGSKPSMAGAAGSETSPGFEGERAGDSGVLSPRIMEGGVEFEWPGSDQGSLEHRGPEVRGTKR